MVQLMGGIAAVMFSLRTTVTVAVVLSPARMVFAPREVVTVHFEGVAGVGWVVISMFTSKLELLVMM